MRLATIRTPDGTRAVRVDDDGAVETGHPDVGALLRDGDWRRSARDAAGRRHEIGGLDYAPPVTHPDKIICVGLNYLDHIAETGRARPERPTLFPKFASTLIGAHDPIEMPRDDESTMIDWEAELGVVIGSRARRVTGGDAAAAIAGYTVCNDISVRDFQNHTAQFMAGKAWEHTCPVGPHLLVASGSEPPELDIRCEVDGELMQSSNTRELCFGPVALVEYISTFTTLEPGDLVLTGTPGGVGVARDPQVWLRRGQTVTTTIAGVGVLRNVCR
jgi:acylpyruvate hydrolase